MTKTFHSYEPGLGHRLRHDPFNSIVGPRPIGWIGSKSATGVLNLAPYSFFNAFNYVPPIIGFSSVGPKDSLRNIEETRDFTWNLVTFPLAESMNQTSAMLPPETNEFETAGLTPLASTLVSAPRVAESPVSFECRCSQIIQLTTSRGEAVPSWLVLGEAVMIHIDETLVADGVYHTAVAEPILRGGGPADYFRIGKEQLFRMQRPGGYPR